MDGTTVDKFKARYVGCGYNQVQGVDYVDSFCSTLRLESRELAHLPRRRLHQRR